MKTSNSKPIAIREQECAVVPHNHIGKIPGIYVGQSWASKSLSAEWGVHRTPAKSICANGTVGALSIILAHGITEDRDDGYEFIYSGFGGRSKREGVSCNRQLPSQELLRYNLYLALTCNAPVDAKKGGRAINWRNSQPIRICRASTLKSTHPQFAPTEGFRYDGEYKIVKYWPYTGM